MSLFNTYIYEDVLTIFNDVVHRNIICMRHEAQHGKYHKASKYTGGTIDHRHQHRVSEGKKYTRNSIVFMVFGAMD